MSKNNTVRNDLFDKNSGFDRGRGLVVEAAWRLTSLLFFLTPVPWPSAIRRTLLRCFGARIGKGFYIRARVNIHFPWKLEVGDNCWIGESCELLNLEPVVLGDNVALAHEVYLAAAGHNTRSRSMAYANRPINVRSGTWIATRAFVGPGVTIGSNCVVAACAVVIRDVPDNWIVAGNPARHISDRRVTEL